MKDGEARQSLKWLETMYRDLRDDIQAVQRENQAIMKAIGLKRVVQDRVIYVKEDK